MRARLTMEPSATVVVPPSCGVLADGGALPSSGSLGQFTAPPCEGAWPVDTFFDEFYSHYYRFSPAIADAMRADSGMGNGVRIALVEPLVRRIILRTARSAALQINPQGHPPG